MNAYQLIEEGQLLSAPGFEYSAWLQKIKKFFDENDVDAPTKQAVGSAIQLSEHQHWFNKYRNDFLAVLTMYVEDKPQGVLDIMTNKNDVFIVYAFKGRTVMLDVKDIIQNDFGFVPHVLNISKYAGFPWDALVQESKDCGKAVVIMTADDIVTCENGEYSQSRPNVFIELGYMIRQCGLENVTIVLDRDCILPSDIQNIIHVQYQSDRWTDDLRNQMNRGDDNG